MRLSPRPLTSEETLKRQNILWAATGAVLAAGIAIIGFSRGMSLAWPWAALGALLGLLLSLAVDKARS